jgi:subtilase family serine protease
VYVLRSTVDKSNRVVEENEADNSSYAYIKVTGEDIQIMERGQA